jgi:hypothetical protein
VSCFVAWVVLVTSLVAAPADAARRFQWTDVVVRDGDDAKRVAKALRSLLERASHKAKWGRGNTVKLSARVTRFDWEEHDDVLRLTITVVARTELGKTARSHLRVGGRPSERRKIEREALGIVASGLVTRLSEIARER